MDTQDPPATITTITTSTSNGTTPDSPIGAQAYRRLLAEIGRGDLPPGARLREQDLAERLGLSRTPVREAIRRLEADGLVEHLPRQGACVRRLGYAEVAELYEMRAVHEATAARLAARVATDMELAELVQIQADLTAAGHGAQARDLNRQFHQALMLAAKNRFLARSMAVLQRMSLILGPTTLDDPARARAALAEHDALIAALKSRDGALAEAAMRAHLDAAHRMRLRALRQTMPRLGEGERADED